MSEVTKNNDVIERDTYLDMQDRDGNVERYFPYTKFKNIQDIPTADDDTVAPVKLYSTTGENLDGALSQKTATEKLTKVQAALQLLAANSYIIDDVTGKTYKIGSNDGKFYFEESIVSPMEVINMIISAAENLVNSVETEEN